jgi:DMSO/TMAO reductase YedYZ molybdopterin-dependent catalytic subunit
MNTKRRTFLSFATLLVFGATFSGGWAYVFRQMGHDGIPTGLRKVLDWNGSLWQSLFSTTRQNPGANPGVGRKPRFNGNVGLKSPIDLATWTMEIVSDDKDPSAKSFRVALAEIKSLPKVESSGEFRCIEGWSEPVSYAGVRFSEFLKYYKIGFHSDQKTHFPYVGLATPDGEYYVSIDMESMLHPQTVLAYEMNGAPLDLKNGAPLRLVIPVKYGIKNLKRIGKIFFSDVRPPDYWAEQGYDWFSGL